MKELTTLKRNLTQNLKLPQLRLNLILLVNWQDNKLALIKPRATVKYYGGIIFPENDYVPTACLKHLKSTRHKTIPSGFRWQRSVVRKWVEELVKLLKKNKRESDKNRREKTSQTRQCKCK